MQVSTTRFGVMNIQEDQIIHMPAGVIGFPEDRRYILLEHKKGSPFLWLQSLDSESLAFVLIDPLLFKADYEIQLSPEDCQSFGLPDGANGLQTLVIVNITQGPPCEITANLLAPIVISAQKKLAKQVVLYQSSYSTRHPIPTSQK